MANNNMDDFNFDDVDLNFDNDSQGGDMFGNSSGGDMFGGSDGNDMFGGSNQSNMGSGNPNMDFQDDGSGSDFFDDSGDDDLSDDQRSALSKKYIIIIVAGLVFTLLVLFVGSRVLGKKKESNEMLDNINNQQVSTTNENTNVNVDNILGGGNSNNKQYQAPTQSQDVNVNYHRDENDFSWMEITDSENVVFEQEYAERIFTITTIKHYARTVDSANNLVLKSTLSGSISGLPGTYTIEVPYSKGILLKSGNSFTVNVLLGTYNDKIVVGDITY